MLKIGIIGCGKITQVRHAPEYAENPGSVITAFYDGVPQRAEDLARQYGAKAYANVEELLASGVDAVSVCVANADHAAITIQALNAGKHVLCEKPMATTLQDCAAMNQAAQKNKKYLMIGHNQRLAKAHVAARKRVEAGEIGRVICFETHFGHPGPEGWTGEKNSWFFDKKRAAFGAMADLGVHKTDLIHFLLGEPIVAVSANVCTLDKTFPDGSLVSVDDNAFCLYTTQSGVQGTLHVSWTLYGEENNSTILYGTKGVLRCYNDPKYSLVLEKPDGTKAFYQLDQLTSNKDQQSGGRTNTGVIDAFVESILTGTPPAISGEEAIKAMRVVFAAEEASAKKAQVQVKQA
ncbi:MAG: Gfo/Idh/MocA family protein [Oscillospiraceae bacterium]